MRDTRWPDWVFGTGDEPDYRFSFANERTFLAWIRTALALIAGGVVLDAITLSMPAALQLAMSAVLVALGVLCAIASWFRWAMAERAMRRGEPLPSTRLAALLACVLAVTALTIMVVVI